MKKNIKFIVLGLLVIGVVTWWQYTVWQAKNTASPSTNTLATSVVNDRNELETNTLEPVQNTLSLTFIFTDNDQQIVDYSLTENSTENLLAITETISRQKNWEFAYQDYGQMGSLLTKIGNWENGQDKKYWQYFVDGQQPQVSADQYLPKAGEKIEWRFAESKF